MPKEKEAHVARVRAESWDTLANTVGTQPFFMDGTPNRKAAGCPDVPPFMYNILAFGGSPVLNPSGTGLGRLAGAMKPNVPSFGTNGGQLLFMRTHPKAILNMTGEKVRVPELTAVYLPPGVDLSQPISMHVFFSPHTGIKKGPYPYGSGPESFAEMTDNYLVSGGKRLLNQCNASGKRVVFLFPLAPPETQFRGILPAARLRRFLQEAAFYLMRTVGGITRPPQLGVCSASCFSAGAQTLIPLMKSSIGEGEFPELKEAYFLDGFPGGGAGFADLAQTIDAWWSGGASGRSVRLYAHFGQYVDPAFRPAFAKAPTSQMTLPNGGTAFATELQTATLAYTPQAFWEAVVNEMTDGAGYFNPPSQPSLYGPERDHDKVIHQLMPEFFLQHALASSSHPGA